jgi:AcrR family transcriptional regulator
MGRWEPNARGRLAQAALTLYAEQGFEQTTAAEIARAAGLTERTFFRHFADKREVLFYGAIVQETPELARVRAKVVSANPELRERELVKLAEIATAMSGALRDRGVPEPAASLAAETGIAVYKVAFARWISAPGQPDLPAILRESLAELKSALSDRLPAPA